MKLALIANQPYPYRLDTYDLLASKLGQGNFLVIYSTRREENRPWHSTDFGHNSIFLKRHIVKYGDEGFRHVNPDIFRQAGLFNPDVVMIYGDGFTGQAAYLWAKMHGRRVILWSDSWKLWEDHYTPRQRWLKGLMARHADAVIVAGEKGRSLYREYGADPVVSHIPIDTHRFYPLEITPKLYDVIYVAQFVDRKMPLFVAEVLNRLSIVRHTSALIIGDGPLYPEFKRLVNSEVSLRVVHKVDYDQMPYFYRLSQILLMPTRCELWGQVAGEALASGVPVITCENAACANEMVWHRLNGYVLPLDAERWATKVHEMLMSDMGKLSSNAVETAGLFTLEKSVHAIMRALNG